MSNIGVIHYNFPDFSFEQFLRFAAETGFQWVELPLADVWDEKTDSQPEKSAEKVRDLVQSYGLRVSAFAPRNDFVQVDPEAIAAQVARLERTAGLARILDEKALLRCEGGFAKPEVAPDQYLSSMTECYKRAAEFATRLEITLAVDNHGTVSNDGDLMLALLQNVDCPFIGTNLDTMNYRWMGHSIADCDRFYTQLAPYVKHVHLKDGFDSRENYKGAALGEGEIHLEHALACLKAANYQGAICAEYEGPELVQGAGYAKCYQWMKARL